MTGGGERFRNEVLVADWPAPAHVRAFTTLRGPAGHSQPPFENLNLGARCGDDPVAVLRNRRELETLLGMPSPPHWLRQVHGTDVIAFDLPPVDRAQHDCSDPEGFATLEGAEPAADAAVTRVPGVVLAILTADCLPILLCAEDGSEVAAVHAGWRGLAAGVIEACVGRLGAPAANLLAWLGPAIGAASYEVGEEVRAAFLAHDQSTHQAFSPTRPGHWHCDLYALATRRLEALGVTRVHGGGFDTCSDPRFFSYRRDGARSGRFASLIYIGRKVRMPGQNSR